MPKYTIDGKEVSQEEMQQHMRREVVRKDLLFAATRARDYSHRGVPITDLGANELLGLCVEWSDAWKRAF